MRKSRFVVGTSMESFGRNLKIAQECAHVQVESDYMAWWGEIRRVASWLFQKEVKTPLSFFFKIIPYMTGLWIAVLYSPVPTEYKFAIIKFSAVIFCLLCLFIAAFAFIKPQNLVFGESGHRAAMKFTYGTDKKELTAEEIASIPGIKKPPQLSAGEDPS